MDIQFTQANIAAHRDALLELNVEYVSWVVAEIERMFPISVEALVGMPIPDYAASAIDKLCCEAPPRGVFYLVSAGGTWVGMGGLRRLRADAAEIKRIYVRAPSRGMRLGERILERLMNDARGFGYSRLLLDTAPFMTSAQRVYEKAGFVDRGPYPEVELPEPAQGAWRFMERDL